eukprot:scaffold40_cov305-Pinguiococcus_pyrenoidosus.AAC.6
MICRPSHTALGRVFTSRSFPFGITIRCNPARRAARSFCCMPPTGRMRPWSVISPVTATVRGKLAPLKSETRASMIAAPALGRSHARPRPSDHPEGKKSSELRLSQGKGAAYGDLRGAIQQSREDVRMCFLADKVCKGGPHLLERHRQRRSGRHLRTRPWLPPGDASPGRSQSSAYETPRCSTLPVRPNPGQGNGHGLAHHTAKLTGHNDLAAAALEQLAFDEKQLPARRRPCKAGDHTRRDVVLAQHLRGLEPWKAENALQLAFPDHNGLRRHVHAIRFVGVVPVGSGPAEWWRRSREALLAVGSCFRSFLFQQLDCGESANRTELSLQGAHSGLPCVPLNDRLDDIFRDLDVGFAQRRDSQLLGPQMLQAYLQLLFRRVPRDLENLQPVPKGSRNVRKVVRGGNEDDLG